MIAKFLAVLFFCCLPSGLLQADVVAQPMAVFSEFTGPVIAVHFTPDGQVVQGVSGDRTVKGWDLTSNVKVTSLVVAEPIASAAFYPDGQKVLIGSNDQKARLRNLSTGRAELTFNAQSVPEAVSLSPDGAKALVGGGQQLDLWGGTGVLFARFTDHGYSIKSTAFSPDSRYVASGGGDGIARVWDGLTREIVHVLLALSPIRSIAYSPDGSRLAAALENGKAQIWSTESGESAGAVIGDGMLTSIAYSPDGRHLLAGSSMGDAFLWDVVTGAEVRRFAGNGSHPFSVAFSPDADRVAIGYFDHSIRVWDSGLPPAPGAVRRILLEKRPPVGSADLNADYAVDIADGLEVQTPIVVPTLVPTPGPRTWHVSSSDGDSSTGDGSAGAPFNTIQQGIDAAGAQDTVRIHSGVYIGEGNRNLRFFGKPITVSGNVDDPALVVLDCESAGRGFTFDRGETPLSVLEGVTIRNGWTGGETTPFGSKGGGIYCFHASPTVRRCIIRNNAADPGAGAIYYPISGIGGGVYLETSSASFSDCTITENRAVGGPSSGGYNPCRRGFPGGAYGGGVACLGVGSTFVRCTITNNSLTPGTGLDCYGGPTPSAPPCTCMNVVGQAVGEDTYGCF